MTFEEREEIEKWKKEHPKIDKIVNIVSGIIAAVVVLGFVASFVILL